jgi:hypothetical protein
MEATVRIADVRTFQTKSGNTRFVLRDESGKGYTTFREEIGRAALAAQGSTARIEYHETQRDGFQKVYLDAVEPLPDEAAAAGDDESADEVAWKTAVESRPGCSARRRPSGRFLRKSSSRSSSPSRSSSRMTSGTGTIRRR